MLDSAGLETYLTLVAIVWQAQLDEVGSGCDAMVAYQLPKLDVAGSSPVSRSVN
jgi:hypothetical protein